MRFSPVEKVRGALVAELKLIQDERGFFARAFCEQEFAEQGVHVRMVQANMSYNRFRGMVRGLHWQVAPHEEAKFVRCIRGAVFDVVVDVRRDSPTFKNWFGIELSAENRLALYIPPGCAHAYQVLEDESEVFYQVSSSYAPQAERGARWNDPAFGIEWPIKADVMVSEKDGKWPDFAA